MERVEEWARNLDPFVVFLRVSEGKMPSEAGRLSILCGLVYKNKLWSFLCHFIVYSPVL